jgi:hypothetical protein
LVVSVANFTTLRHLAVDRVDDRIVGRLDPDFLAALADALVFGRLVFAAPERFPEHPVGRAVALLRLDEHAVMLSLDFRQAIAERVEKRLVGGDDGAVGVEVDHGLRLVDRLDLAIRIDRQHLLRRDVGRELDHLVGFAAAHQRIVRGLDPDRLAALADALVLGRLEFALVQRRPEIAVRRALAFGLGDEHAVVLALDLLEAVAERIEKILIGRDDRPIHVEFDHGLRLVERIEHRALVARRREQHAKFLGKRAWAAGAGAR